MFTGIIEELGKIKRVSKRGSVTSFEIIADKVTEGIKIGDSISCNGVCLTLVKQEKNQLTFEVIPATLNATNLKYLRPGELVNLERSLKIGDRISGHFVLGHVDCVGVIRNKKILSKDVTFTVSVLPEYIKYCLPKGSIALDGISLTIQEKGSDYFIVSIIPHTLKETTLGLKNVSDRVNIEFDILAKRPA